MSAHLVHFGLHVDPTQAQLLQLFAGAFQKLAVLGRGGVQRAVRQRLPQGRPLLAETSKISIEIRPGKFLPDVVLRHFRRMQHIGRVKAVVAQIVRHQLVGREVGHARQQVAHNVRGQPQHRFAHRVQWQRVLEVAHRAHRQHEAQLGVDAFEVGVGFGQGVDNFIRRQQLAHKQVGQLLVAVAHQFAGFAQAVGPGCAQR